MIEETCLEITQLYERWQSEKEQRYARRNKIRYIDQMLNEFELLNLAEEPEIPGELIGRVKRFVDCEEHPIARRHLREVHIGDWMEALYDIQDSLMLTVEDDID
jgi:hypothetical protein